MKSIEKQWLKIALTTSCLWALMMANEAHAQCTTCNGSFLTENYTSATAWTADTSDCKGTVSVGGTDGNVLLNNAQEGRSKRVYRNIPTLPYDPPSNHDDWTAEAEVKVMGGNAGTMNIMAFTSGNLDPWFNDAGCPPGCATFNCYTPTNQDAIIAYLTSGPAPPSSPNCCASPTTPGYHWSFVAGAKKGTNFLPPSAPIDLPSFGITYYVRLQRTWSSQGMVSVFSDSAMTKHLPGSPQCFPIDPNIQTLNVLQHGVMPQGSANRVITATIDNLRVCSGNTCPLPLTPSFTTKPSYCDGTPITVNGSANGVPLPELNHEWLITESDQFGNTTFNPATTWSQWFPGLAGAFTFPSSLYAASGGFIHCGKYYLVRLGVQNCGNRFVSTGHVIRINCKPSVSISGPNWICKGASVTLTHTPVVATSYLWTPGGQTTSTIIVQPAVTTTYTLTVTDINGCQGTPSYTANVVPAALDIDITTGIDNTSGNLISYGAADDTWRLRAVPGLFNSADYALLPFAKVVQPYKDVFFSWVKPGNERWISNQSTPLGTVVTQNASTLSDPVASKYYWYEFQFYLLAHYSNLAVKVQKWARDNALDLYLNPSNLNTPDNALFTFSGTPNDPSLFTSMGLNPTLNNNQAFYHFGVNRLLIRQENLAASRDLFAKTVTGFVLRGNITGQCTP